jgi:hypothetical protein
VNGRFNQAGISPGVAVMIAILMIAAAWILIGCQAQPTPTPVPTATPMPTATVPPPTATPNLAATQTAQAAQTEAAKTAQAQASLTAQAAAAAAAQTQVAATMAAQRAAGTATAAAQFAAATATAVSGSALRDAIVKNATKSFGPAEGTIEAAQSPGRPPWTFTTSAPVANFVAEVRFFNPSETGNQWDYGFWFRAKMQPPCPAYYALWVRPDKTYMLSLFTGKPGTGSQCEIKQLTRGAVSNLDVSPTGSNLLQLVVFDKAAYFSVNGQFQTTFDVPEIVEAGNVWLRANATQQSQSPVRFADFTVSQVQ